MVGGLSSTLICFSMACVLYSAALAFAGPSGARPYRAGVEMMAKSKSLPFLEAPPQLASQYAGDVGFDPLGFSKSGPQTLTWMREAELKHSRVCMLAVAGWLVVDLGIHFPGAQYEGLRALTAHNAMVESGNMWLLLIAVSILELAGGLALYEQANGSGRAAGDYKFDPLGYAQDEATLQELQLKEIKNGRLAMIAFSGIVTQAALSGRGLPYF
uniref:Uncharacterized protein n=2 Tax=Diacronema lutheri TaxID=2081491 RepID=A0A6T6C8U9_DIALT